MHGHWRASHHFQRLISLPQRRNIREIQNSVPQGSFPAQEVPQVEVDEVEVVEEIGSAAAHSFWRERATSNVLAGKLTLTHSLLTARKICVRRPAGGARVGRCVGVCRRPKKDLFGSSHIFFVLRSRSERDPIQYQYIHPIRR